MKTATQVWLSVALLQRETGRDATFSTPVIERRIEAEHWAGGVDKHTLSSHISGHCLASARPGPARARMLTRTSRGRYRLYRPGDPTHPGRLSGRTTPAKEDVPATHRDLLAWYETEYATLDRAAAMDEFIRIMRESGAFRGVDADAYVRDQRLGWDDDASPAEEPALPEPLAGGDANPLLDLRATAMDSGIRKGIDPGDYARELREGWE